MPSTPNVLTRFLGCDVGKASLVVFDSLTGRTSSLPNTPAALSDFTAGLDDSCLIVCESTGGYEALLLAAALADGRAAHRADGRKVKAFIRSFGTLAKTDTLDARALARYGQERHAHLRHWQAPDPHRDSLQTLVLTRRDLVDQRQACKNRLQAPGAAPVALHLEAVVQCLTAQIKAIEHDVEALIQSKQPLARAIAALRTIAGIGKASAPALLALMPELGHLNRRQVAALAGLAPHPNQSGTADRYRPTRGGRPEVKRVLFMAALVASRHSPALKPFYQRLITNGKKPLLAIAAVMRKLIVIANAVLRDLIGNDLHAQQVS